MELPQYPFGSNIAYVAKSSNVMVELLTVGPESFINTREWEWNGSGPGSVFDSQLIRAELNAGQSEQCLKHTETTIHHSACRSHS